MLAAFIGLTACVELFVTKDCSNKMCGSDVGFSKAASWGGFVWLSTSVTVKKAATTQVVITKIPVKLEMSSEALLFMGVDSSDRGA